jgi:hypothetical protein
MDLQNDREPELRLRLFPVSADVISGRTGQTDRRAAAAKHSRMLHAARDAVSFMLHRDIDPLRQLMLFLRKKNKRIYDT